MEACAVRASRGALRGPRQCEPYLDWWRSWERDGYPAGRQLPATFETRPVTRVSFQVGTTEWVVAVAGVQTDSSEGLEWQPTLSDGLI